MSHQKLTVMIIISRNEKFRFWRKWTFLNAIVIILSYPIGFIVGLFISEAMGYSVDEWGTPVEQTLMLMGFGILIGFGIGITQRILLKKVFNVSSLWLYSLTVGFIITELIVGIICWKLDVNRGDLSFIEGNPFTHAIILSISGLLIGLIQLPLLRKHFTGIAYWLIASTLAWGISVLITAIGHKYDTAVLITYILGAVLYGAITGATLMWIMKLKEVESN